MTIKSSHTTRNKNTAFYVKEERVIDEQTGEILSDTTTTITKTSSEPDYIKVYYQTMMAFNQIYDIPVEFVLSLSKFIEWSNEGDPLTVILNKQHKDIIMNDCKVSPAQIDRYIRKSVDTGLLFRTQYRGVYEVNPFMIAKGRWDSIKVLRSNYDFIGGQWNRQLEWNKPTMKKED